MKKHLLLLFAALLPLVASAEKVEIGGIWYNLTAETREAEVTWSDGDEYSGSITLPATVTYDGVAYSVTSIGNEAFYDCSSLNAITIPEGVTSIGNWAFESCISLTAITIPEGVTSIGDYAFLVCSSLTSIVVAKGNKVYDSRGDCNAIIETNSNTLIKGCATTIIPEGVTSIGSSAFEGCSSLTVITIPEGVTSIGNNAFFGCSNLTAINIPASVTSIGNYAFYECSSLTAIVVAKGNKVYDSRGDCNAIIETNSNTLILGCATTIIPEGVTSIGDNAFYWCNSLTAITIPEGVTSIGEGAFYGCSNLSAITLPEGVTSIGGSAFDGCSSLTVITIPEGVTSIGDWAFGSCSSLTDVYCYAATVPSTGTNAFYNSNIGNVTLHVPASAMDEYKNTAPWSRFGTIEAKKCATPTISYTDGKVVLTCETEGAKVITDVVAEDARTYEDLEFTLSATYTLTAYATKEYYENSDTVTLTICWVPCDENHEGGTTDILTIPAKPALIQCQSGVITLSGLDEGTAVAAYSTAGTELATATATDGTATLTTDLTAGTIAIVKTGDYSIKVAIK